MDQVLWSLDTQAGGTPALQDPTKFWMTDINGSVVGVCNAQGFPLEWQRYDAYGKTDVLSSNGAPEAQSGLGNRLGFQGRTGFPEFGLQYFRNRFYDPALGRFLSRDPLGLAAGMNMYAAFGGDPINRIDPLGLDGDDEEPIVDVTEYHPKPKSTGLGEWGRAVLAAKEGKPYKALPPREVQKQTAEQLAEAKELERKQMGWRQLTEAAQRFANVLMLGRTGIGTTSQAAQAWLDTTTGVPVGSNSANEPAASSAEKQAAKNPLAMKDGNLVKSAESERIAAGTAAETGSSVDTATGEAKMNLPESLSRDRVAKLNAQIAEQHGWEQAKGEGRIGIRGPRNVNAPGPDYITYDPKRESIIVADAKYRGPGGTYPKTIPEETMKRWTPEVESAIEAMPEGSEKAAAKKALAEGRVIPEIFRWPPQENR